MEGFFSKKEGTSNLRPDGKTYSCVSCELYKDCKSPKMTSFGNFKKKIMNIGEAPGEVEDERGKPFQGKTGKLLELTYRALGIDLFEDCININAANCRPTDEDGNNRPPTNFEIECCRPIVQRAISEYKPKVIVLLGNSAVYSMIGHRWKKDLGGIMKWRGWAIPDQDYKAWICPTFHPSFVERSEGKVEKVIWVDDLKQAFEKAKEPFPVYVEPKIDVIEDLSVLDYIPDHSFVAIDYETTGLKPHAEGHRIICASVADSRDHAYVFMMPETKKERMPFLDLLANPKIWKVAQNMKFEEAWSVVRLRQPVIGWAHDTMLATHVLDNRPGITGLKFQTYVNFGIVDYASEIDYFLKPKDSSSANNINRIMEVFDRQGGKNMLLQYCGLDAIYELRLYEKQSENILPF